MVSMGKPQGDLAVGGWVGGTLPVLLSKGKRAEIWQPLTSQANEALLETQGLGSRSTWVKSRCTTHEPCDPGQAT